MPSKQRPALPHTLVSITASTIRVVDDRHAEEVHSFEVTRTKEGLEVYESVSCGCEGGCYVCEGRGMGEQSYTMKDCEECLAWARAKVARMCGAGWTCHTMCNGFRLTELAS